MQRPIVRFGHDDEGVPIALLSCGHPQHIRHNPPFVNRAWITTEQGRASMLGQTLNCVRCEAFELPPGFVPHERTPIFTETSLPAGLRQSHATGPGVWAKILVLEGRLRYHVIGLSKELDLSPTEPGIVVPEVAHWVEPLGSIKFFLEFYRAPTRAW
jgi:tellurite methyltransferase